MRSQKLMRFAAMITLSAALVATAQAAQDNDERDHHQHHRYKFVDIGTFGGPESYVNAAFSLGSPNQINNRGAVVGAAATHMPTPPNKQICGGPDGIVPFVFHAFEWQNDALTDLGALPVSNAAKPSRSMRTGRSSVVRGMVSPTQSGEG